MYTAVIQSCVDVKAGLPGLARAMRFHPCVGGARGGGSPCVLSALFVWLTHSLTHSHQPEAHALHDLQWCLLQAHFPCTECRHVIVEGCRKMNRLEDRHVPCFMC